MAPWRRIVQGHVRVGVGTAFQVPAEGVQAERAGCMMLPSCRPEQARVALERINPKLCHRQHGTSLLTLFSGQWFCYFVLTWQSFIVEQVGFHHLVATNSREQNIL